METDVLVLLDRLNRETSFLSFHDQNHPIFKKIVARGMRAVPPLLDRLKTDPCWWSMIALATILPGSREVPEEDMGRFDALVAITLKWVEEHPALT